MTEERDTAAARLLQSLYDRSTEAQLPAVRTARSNAYTEVHVALPAIQREAAEAALAEVRPALLRIFDLSEDRPEVRQLAREALEQARG